MGQRGVWSEINQTELEKLAALQCTDEEIASWFGVTTRTIERRRQRNPKFAATLDRGKNKGKISLRRQQMKLVEEGSAAMAIFLGKNYLGQSDSFAQNPNASTIYIVTSAVSLQAQDAIAQPEPTVIDVTPGDSSPYPRIDS